MNSNSHPTCRRLTAWLVLAGGLVAIILLDEDLARLVRIGGHRGELIAGWGYWLGHGAVVIPPLVLLWLLSRKLNWTRMKACAGQAVWAFALSGVANQILKYLIGRPRPRLLNQDIWSPGMTLASGLNSFPSGHTTTSMAVALIFSFYYPRGAPIFMLWAAFVGAARIAGGAHFPLDVLAGVVLGLMTGWVVIHWADRHRLS
ncbi:MAG: phosphatase PAP2 family protein [Deltaproteobacteria bacterium]|nr:phosphatase PAP2 family protein [Deltaproteobacteria bacterium]